MKATNDKKYSNELSLFRVAATYDKKYSNELSFFLMWQQYMTKKVFERIIPFSCGGNISKKKIIKRAKLNKISILVYDLKKKRNILSFNYTF